MAFIVSATLITPPILPFLSMWLHTTVLLAALATAYGGPTIKLGSTTLNGLSLPELGVEFFGGETYVAVHGIII